MSWIAAIIVGAIIGWLASKIMKTDAQQGALANVVIGIVGSLLSQFLFVDLLGVGGATVAGTFTVAGIFWGVAGSIVLITILKALKVLK